MTAANTIPEHDAPYKREVDPLRLAPHSEEAETAVLGAILMNPESYHSAAPFLEAEDFFFVKHGWVWEAVQRLQQRHDAVDELTVGEELRAYGHLEDVGGPGFLAYLFTSTPSALHAETYAHIVERASLRRRLLSAAGQIAMLAHDEERDIDAVLDQSMALMLGVTSRRLRQFVKPLRLSVSKVFDEVEKRRQEETPPGIPTGFYDLDKVLGGLQRGDLIVVAGRPRMGKSTLLQGIAVNSARQAGSRWLIFSYEMVEDQWTYRMYAAETNIDTARLLTRTHELTDAEWTRFVSAAGRLSELPIHIDDSPRLDVLGLSARARQAYRELGIDGVMVDYVQKIPPGALAGRNSTKANEVGAVIVELKNLAKELNIPVVAAAQLNRACEMRDDKRPMLSDLGESGQIEREADVVLFLYRDELYNEATSRPHEADVIVAKHRNGPSGTASLLFQGEYTRFSNLRHNTINLNDAAYGSGKSAGAGKPNRQWVSYADDEAAR